jgi:hypothetical protein
VPTVAQASATTVAASQSGTSIRLASDAATDPTVTFNTQSKKYHCPTCRYAKQCTKNCIEIKKSEAVAKGGVVCKICGGTCK